MMKKIGFIDYYLSEWHANSYPAWFKEVCEKTGLNYEVAYAYAEKNVSPVDGKTTDEWCEKYGVKKCATVKELCDKSDFVIILAPTNPETHLELCKEAFRYCKGGRMYIDKTFAPDLKTAKEIFSLAKEGDIDFFSTSALRYCSDFNGLKNVKSITTFYGGSNLEEYIIHQIESVVKVMAAPADKLKAEKDGETTKYEIMFKDGRSAFMEFNVNNGYRAKIEYTDGAVTDKILAPGYFVTLSEKILNFFETGLADFDKSETLEVMNIRDNAIKAKEETGVWLKL